MPLFIPAHQTLFAALFDSYQRTYAAYWASPSTKRQAPHSIVRKFDVRMRLALGLQISFDTKYAQTRTPEIAHLYKLTLKINEAWFAYEALLNICESANLVKLQKVGSKTKMLNTDPFEFAVLDNFSLSAEIVAFNEHLQANLLHKNNLRADMIGYVHHLIEHSGPGLRKTIRRCLRKLNLDKQLHFVDILNLIYAIRNLYVHNGDAAKTGVKNYTTKIKLLENIADFLLLICLKIGIIVIK
jgi:hypothetical protein